LLAIGAISLAFSIEWLLLGVVLIFFGLFFAERTSPHAPSEAGMDFATQQLQQPVVVQTSAQSPAYNFYTELVNNVIQTSMEKKDH
jgi:hypothetical protein